MTVQDVALSTGGFSGWHFHPGLLLATVMENPGFSLANYFPFQISRFGDPLQRQAKADAFFLAINKIFKIGNLPSSW